MEITHTENIPDKCIKHVEIFCSKSKEKIIKIIGVGCDIRQHFYDSEANKYFYKDEEKTIELEITCLENAKNQFIPASFQLGAICLDSNKLNSYDLIYFCCAMNSDNEDIFKCMRYAKLLIKKKKMSRLL
jgi:hypothetical protein